MKLVVLLIVLLASTVLGKCKICTRIDPCYLMEGYVPEWHRQHVLCVPNVACTIPGHLTNYRVCCKLCLCCNVTQPYATGLLVALPGRLLVQ